MNTNQATACRHGAVSVGQVYEYCEACGAVRVRPDLRPTDGAWHSCDECRLKQAARAALAQARGGA